MDTENNILEIPIEDIIPNRFQPRLTFNEEGLNELSESIKQHGIIQPLVVRKLGDKYEIIAGERRYKAATQAGLTKVPVIISDLDDNKSAEVALVENIQRRNLTSIEEAKSYKNLLDRGYLTQEQLANKMGVSQSAIANKLRLLNLDSEVQDALLNEKISERHARALLSLNSEDQKKWLKKILSERLTVRQLDIELKKLKDKNKDDEEEDGGIPLVNINPNIDDILNKAEDINTTRAPRDIASMLIPNQLEIKEDTKIEEKKENPITTKTIPNKFFNFLEDEEVNMDTEESEDIFNSFVPLEKTNETNNNIEVLDDLDDYSANNVQELNNQSTIFEPFKPNNLNVSSANNTIEEIKTTSEEKIVDPMDSVLKLSPDYEEIQEEKQGTDLKSAINKIRDTIASLNKNGFDIELEEADLEDIYDITIKIKKN